MMWEEHQQLLALKRMAIDPTVVFDVLVVRRG